MRMFPFLLQIPALLIFASLHTLPLCLLRSTDRVRTPDFRSLSPILPEPYCIPIYNQLPHSIPYRSFVMAFLSDLLSLLLFRICIIIPFTASSAHFLFAVVPRAFLSPLASHSLAFHFFSVFDPRPQLKQKRSFIHHASTRWFLPHPASVSNTAALSTLYLGNTSVPNAALPTPPIPH